MIISRFFQTALFFLLVSGMVCKAQPYYFTNYQVEHGLSNNTVHAIFQDKAGFIWLGTIDGLNRFDGYSFKVFKKSNQKHGLKSNCIYSIREDLEGILWIGTEKGLYSYDRVYETFTLIPQTEGQEVREILLDKSGSLWIKINSSAASYSPKSGRFRLYSRDKFFHVSAIATSASGDIWLSTIDGKLKKYIEKDNSFLTYEMFPSSYAGEKNLVSLISVGSRLFMGTNGNQIKVFDTRDLSRKTLTIPVDGVQKLYLRKMLLVKDDLWIGSEFGVYIYNLKTGKFSNLKKGYKDPFSLSDNAINGFFQDRESGVWVGTYFGGASYYPRQYTPFYKYSPLVKENPITGNIVRGIKQDKYGDIWIGTEDAGLNKLEVKTGKVLHYSATGARDAISFDNIHGVLTSGNEVWLGLNQNGLDIMDIESGKVTRKYKAGRESGLSSDFIFCLYETSKGEKIIGTASGLFRYNPLSDKFEHFNKFPPDAWYSSVLEDSEGNIYASTIKNGVFYLNTRKNTITNFSTNRQGAFNLPTNYINVCFEDSRHNIWFATNEGLCKWNPGLGKMLIYGARQGFPSEYILSILEDDQKFLWIGTTKGLVKFDPISQKVEVYTRSNGLLSEQFNYNSSLKSKNGQLYFGSLRGLVKFHPADFHKNEFIPPLYITALEVNNQEIRNSDDSKILKRSISFENDITLNYDESNFSLELSALSFAIPNGVKYAFKLEGLSDKWTFLGKSRKIFFTEVPPGNYKLKTKVCNSSGYWGPEESKLKIHIRSPWWLSTIAFIGYSLLAILIIAIVAWLYRRQLQLINQRKLAELRLSKEKEMIKAKMDFFTNVAHEIKTPLTLIKVPLRKVVRETKGIPQISNSLKIIGDNTERLINLTNQLLDFRETEISEYQLELQECAIDGLLTKVFESFLTLADQKGLLLKLNTPTSAIDAVVDVDALEKILYNLLSNAVKYCEAVVEVSLQAQDNSFSVEIINDGSTISDEYAGKIFEPFFRVRHEKMIEGTGLGLPLARMLAQAHGGGLVYFIRDGFNVFLLTMPINIEGARNDLKLKPNNYLDNR